jgi:DNA-directed RNA polymerase beta subunit
VGGSPACARLTSGGDTIENTTNNSNHNAIVRIRLIRDNNPFTIPFFSHGDKEPSCAGDERQRKEAPNILSDYRAIYDGSNNYAAKSFREAVNACKT